mmetsp:Transcript_5984/g.10496  ORF Transcript_5984/g.10496 Transcript_5984/m.10496 type:complete len:304 (+) Transcript_5984:186-1097(+)
MFWMALIFQDKGWSSKVCSFYTLETGAWKVTVSRGLVFKVLMPKSVMLDGFLQRLTPGVRTTEDFKEFICGLSSSLPVASDMCFIGQSVHFASLGLIAASFFGTFCNCCGACMIAMWAYMKPRESLRLWARILYFLTFAIYGGGLAQYAVAAAKLQGLPPENEAVTYGRNVMLASGNCLLSLIPLAMVLVCIGRTKEEALNEHLSFRHKEQREEKRIAAYQDAMGGYGAASYTTAGETFQQPASFDQSWQGQGWAQNSWQGQGVEAGYGAYPQIQMQTDAGYGVYPQGEMGAAPPTGQAYMQQ